MIAAAAAITTTPTITTTTTTTTTATAAVGEIITIMITFSDIFTAQGNKKTNNSNCSRA
jgi:hypothetical protein